MYTDCFSGAGIEVRFVYTLFSWESDLLNLNFYHHFVDYTGFCNGCQRIVPGLLLHSLDFHVEKYCHICKKFFTYQATGGQFNQHFSDKHKNTHTMCKKNRCLYPVTPNGQVHTHTIRKNHTTLSLLVNRNSSWIYLMVLTEILV